MSATTLEVVPKSAIDWQLETDQLAIKVGGVYMVDVTDRADVEFFEGLLPHQELEVRCAVVVDGFAVRWRRDKHGDPAGATALKTLSVSSIYSSD